MKYLVTDHPEYFQSRHKVLSIPVYGEMTAREVADALKEEADRYELSRSHFKEVDDFVLNLILAYPPDEVFIEDPRYEKPIGDMETPLYAYFHFEND